MRVRNQICLLQEQDPKATVVPWEASGSAQPAISKLGFSEVQPLQIGTWESNGFLVLEPWNVDDKRIYGPFPGVVLGSP